MDPTELAAEAGFEAESMEFDEPQIGEKRDLTENGGVFKEIIKAGDGWEKPEKGDKVTVHYVGTLEADGQEFDSSRGRGDPFTFTLGQGQVIKGWDIGVATMKKGELAKFTIKSDFAYGDSGSPPKIPGGATLVFEVELLDWKSAKDISGDGGVIKTTINEGTGWDQPKDDDEVKIRLAAKVLDAAASPVFETPEGGAEFTLKDGYFCKGVGVAVKRMKKGEEARVILKPEYAFGEQGKEDINVPPGASLELTLSLVGWNKVEKVTPDGGVIKKTLEATEEWQRPNAGATVTVAYVAKLEDGTVFEERTESSPLSFVTEEDQAPCEGFELAVMQMKKKERALVTVSAGYAFGIHAAEREGWTASVPPNATVTYDVTLMDFVKAKETWDMSVEEKLEAATVSKDKGNASFKAGKLDRAQKLWERAKQAIEYDDSFEPDQKKTAREIKRSCELNLAALHLKEGRFVEARKAADKVLDTDSFHLKALYRRAQAYMGTGDWVEAAQDIKKALGVDAQNKDFRLLAKRLKAAEAEATKGEAALWAESFAKMAATRKALEVKATGAVVNGAGVDAAIEADAGTADGAVAPMAAES